MLLLVARRLRDDPRASRRPSTRWLVLAGRAGRLRFLTKMLQALLVLPGVRAGLPGRRADHAAAGGCGSCWPPALAMLVVGRLVGRDRRAVPGVDAALHRRLAEQQHARADLRLQRPRPARPATRPAASAAAAAAAAAAGARPASPGCSTPRSAARSPGCCPAALIAARRRRWSSPGARPRTDRAARRAARSGAAGWWSPALVFSFMAGHLPRLLHGRPGPGDRRAGRHRRRRCCGSGAARAWARVVLAGDAGRHRGVGVRPAGPVRRTSCPGCAGWCWSPASSPRSAAAGRRPGRPRRRRVAVVAVGLVAALAGPAAYALDTAATAHTGVDPDGRARRCGGGFGGGPGGRWLRPAPRPPAAAGPAARSTAAPGRAGARAPARAARRPGRRPLAAAASAGCSTAPTPAPTSVAAARRRTPTPTPGSPRPSAPTTPPGYQLATGDPVMAARRLQRQRPVADAGPVPAVRGRRQGPLLHRRRRRHAQRRRQRRAQRRSPPGWRRTSPPRRSAASTLYDLSAPA